MYVLPVRALMSLMKKKRTLVEDTETGMLVCLKDIPGRPVGIIHVLRNGSEPPEGMNIS